MWRDNFGFFVNNNYAVIGHSIGEVTHMNEGCLIGLEKLCKTKVPIKVQVFYWRLILNRLSTRSQLVMCGIMEGTHNIICPLCFLDEKYDVHIFLFSPISVVVRYGLNVWLGIPIVESNEYLEKHVIQFCKQMEIKFQDNLLVCFCQQHVGILGIIIFFR